MNFTSDHRQDSDRVTWERYIARVSHVDAAIQNAASRWPDRVRAPTWPMLRSALRGRPLPAAWKLIRSLDLREYDVDDNTFARWLGDGVLSHVTVLRVTGGSLSIESVLRAIEDMSELHTLHLAGSSWERPMRSLRPTAGSPSLRRWEAHDCDRELVPSFLEHPALQNVVELAVSGVAGAWWEDGVLKQLRALGVYGFPGGASDTASFASAIPDGLVALSFQSGDRAQAILPLLNRELPALRSLDLSRNGLADASLVSAPLVRAGALAQLSLADNPVRGRVLRSLGEQLASLEALDLSRTHVGDVALASVPAGAPLRYLDVSHAGCSGAGIHGVVRGCGQTLRELAVEATAFDDAAVARLGAELPLPALELLNLSRCPIGSSSLVHLLSHANLPALRTLVARGTSLQGCTFEKPPTAHRLEVLSLDRSRWGVEGPRLFFDAGAMPQLCSLRLGTNHLDASAASALAEYASRVALSHVTMDESVMLGADGLANLLESAADGLVELKIGQSFATPASLVGQLARAPLRRLRRLDLLGLILDGTSLAAILANPSLESLESLILQVDEPETAALVASFPILSQLRSITIYGGTIDQEATISAAVDGAPWLFVTVLPV
jgi:hypothetical protein